jgi:hypothetical protein
MSEQSKPIDHAGDVRQTEDACIAHIMKAQGLERAAAAQRLHRIAAVFRELMQLHDRIRAERGLTRRFLAASHLARLTGAAS